MNINKAIEQLTKAAKEQGVRLTITAEAEPQPKSVVPESWDDLDEIVGYYIERDSKIDGVDTYSDSINKNVFSTKELAQAALAIAQLSQLMYRTWDNDGGWRPEAYTIRHNIEALSKDGKDLIIDFDYQNYTLLQFRTKEIAQEFLTKHRKLIDQAAPILFGRVAE
jgi:hypothetical protein